MHRVELKVISGLTIKITVDLFLMHRVELKAVFYLYNDMLYSPVPNAPCGVESLMPRFPSQAVFQFLMHRVELKGLFGC